MTASPVVVGIDGSSTSREALVWAAHEAHLRGAPLRAVHARPRPDYDPILAGASCLSPVPLVEEGADVALGTAVDLVQDLDPELPVEGSVCLGAAASVLLDEAEAGAGLLVVGSRGLGAFDSLFLGSVSTHLAARSPAPVVVVPPRTPFSVDGPVVVGVDGAAHSAAAVREGAREAAAREVPLDLVVAHTVPTDTLVNPLSPPSDLRSASQEHARRVAEEAARAARAAGAEVGGRAHVGEGPPAPAGAPGGGPPAAPRAGGAPGADVRTHVVEGPAAQAVAQVAGTAASLVAVGARGHGRVLGPVLGSVSQSVLHHARWPVLVARAGR